jgi:hypothetical protein
MAPQLTRNSPVRCPPPPFYTMQDDAAPGEGGGGSGVTLKLDLPYQLKKALVDDWEYITQK